MKLSTILGVVMLLFCTALLAETHVYTYPDVIVNTNDGLNKKSDQYSVTVSQGGTTKSCYVMYKQNQNPEGNLANNLNDHWTNFSYDGTVTVTVEKIGGTISSCIVHPKKKGIEATISGGKASFQVPEDLAPLQLYAEVDGKPKDALLVFCDPLETDVPNRSSSDVEIINTTDDIATVKSKLNNSKTVVFEEGIHIWNGGNGNSYEGYKMPLKSNKRIYIPGGAYVIGSFSGDNIANTKIWGRGVISQSGKNRLSQSVSIPYSAVYVTGNGNGHELEGVHIVDMAHFAITYRVTANIENVKIMNFWHQTDGVISGDDSRITNCFFKVMDDGVKLYSQRMYVENATHFPQVNGAPYQFCWGAQNGDDCTVINTYIVSCSFKPSLTGTSNTAVINGRNGPGANVETNGHTFDGIYIDNGCHRLIGFEGQGIYKNWTIKNVEINTQDRTPQHSYSYLYQGNYQNWVIENLFVNGVPITGADPNSENTAAGKIWMKGSLQNVKFVVKAKDRPVISTFTPADKSQFEIDEEFTVSATSTIDSTSITGMEIFLDGVSQKSTASTSISQAITISTAGKYYVKVTATSSGGNIAEVTHEIIIVDPNQDNEPYSGTAPDVPCTLEAEHYDIGGELISYHDTDDINQGGVLRTDGVDVEDKNGTQRIGYLGANEWTEYTFNMPANGKVKITSRYATNGNAGNLSAKIYIDDELIENLSLINTGSNSTYAEYVLSETPEIAAGNHILKVEFDYKGACDWTKIELAEPNSINNISENAIEVFPNPFSNSITVKSSIEPQLYDVAGRAVNVIVTKYQDTYEINTSFLNKGVYIVKSGNSVIKVLKE